MTLYGVKPAFQRTLEPASRFAIGHAISANQLTLAAIAVSLLGGIALAASGAEQRLLLIAVPVVALRLALNALDGMVARTGRQAIPAGELLNEAGDRLGDLLLVGGLVLAGHGDVRLGAVALAVIGLPGAVGVTARAAGGTRRYEGPLSKPDRMAALAGASVLTSLLPVEPVINGYFVLLFAGALLTTAIRYRRAHAELQAEAIRAGELRTSGDGAR